MPHAWRYLPVRSGNNILTRVTYSLGTPPPTFPETHPVFGKDDDHEPLVHESRTSKIWTARSLLLRTCISDLLGKTQPGCCNSAVLLGVDGEIWDIIKAALTHQSITSDLEKVSTRRGYQPDTSALAMHRFHRHFTYQGFLAKTTPAFVHVGKFLGHS